jgi:hypothetical protein
MSLAALMRNAANTAANTLAQLQGMPAGAEGNFIGPDGRTYTSVGRAADAFEIAALGRQMTTHGKEQKSARVHTITRDQFDAAPMSWEWQTCSILYPAPATQATIASVSDDDPLFYVFTLIVRHTP